MANEEPTLPLRCALLSNRAVCFLHTLDYNSCVEDCTEVLAIDPAKIKARFRQGLAYEGLGQLSAALEDLKEVRTRFCGRKGGVTLGRGVKISFLHKKSYSNTD